ncbi:uncharacterized protein Dwil_GK24746 [Drosophila willistoni]|uniref:Nuclear pore complex protein n=1 Tax=Drosophila willistoni TaxID=7260 RepID=B4MZZ3_DROWI|nr:nuclear pore complex protein Nup107 [Drosophila willistoni]EDW77928.1 uncharacterized protein Dwil_GK24746 [Drosophila willistoni]
MTDRRSLLIRSTLNNSQLSSNLSHNLPLLESSNLSLNLTSNPDDDDIDRGKGRTDALFSHFYDVLQTHGSDTESFEIINGLTEACRRVVQQLQLEIEHGMGGDEGVKQRELSIKALKQEINTWLLLHALFYDRVVLQTDQHVEDDLMQDGPMLGGSEKEVIDQLYEVNATLREYQLVVDWLEACYESRDPENTLHRHDRMMGWENSLYQLENLQGAAFGLGGQEIIKSLDPDAPVREKKHLHQLDEEDNQRLSKAIFNYIRSGKIDEGLKLSKHYGQIWRAAILEGWRLHEDPNYQEDSTGLMGGKSTNLIHDKIAIEGNPRRDVWKKCAWLLADSSSKGHDDYTRATVGVFCGHLGSLKSILQSNWHDLLWAYLKVQIDIRVESEIRGCCVKRFSAMPDEYWSNKMTLEQIFQELEVAKDLTVRDYAQSQLGQIQKHLILDTCHELIQFVGRWLTPSPHQLRFVTHLVLFLRQINRLDQKQDQSLAEQIISNYIEQALIPRREPQIIAYYVSAVSPPRQIQLYSKFLETVENKPLRTSCLEAALVAGLDVMEITKFTVENIFQQQQTSLDGDLREPAPSGEISLADKRCIYSLEWLIHLQEQRAELLWQANAMMRQYLATSKTECVREVFRLIPSDVVTHLVNNYGSMDNLPAREECSLKEYLCFKVYLTGIDSFNEWTRLHQNPPQKPGAGVGGIAAQDNFTERMASEHKEQTYRNEFARWQVKLQEQSKQTLDSLYNVLLFPEKGWLVDPFIPKEPEDVAILNWQHRQIQMEKLRSVCLPEIALLLLEVMSKSNDFAGCVRLADEIASEQRQLYKVYTKHRMAELLFRIATASQELLNEKLDPWGYPFTA